MSSTIGNHFQQKFVISFTTVTGPSDLEIVGYLGTFGSQQSSEVTAHCPSQRVRI